MSARRSTTRVAWSLVALTGCATYSQEDGEKLATQVYALETQLQATQKALRDTEAKLGTHDEQLADLKTKVDAMHSVAFKSAADFGVQLDGAMQELARLKGIAEGSKERLDAIESQLAKVSDEFKLAEDKRVTATQSEDQKKAAVEEALRRERLFTDPAALTAEVVKLMNDRKIAEARKLIREAVQRADAGQSDKLKKEQDSLQFLIAETYYLEGNYQLAATEYNLVRKNFPKSAKVPEALFKMGQCFESLSLPDDAKLFYKTVVEKHAKSDAAKKARERLAALK
jgi:TolA-binding protein